MNESTSIEEAKRQLTAFQKLKGSFPFRLGTTSYIYPADLLPNAELLGDFFDEIQLLLFESKQMSNIPDDQTIQSLMELAERKRFRYSVHLPMDAYPGEEDEQIRRESVERIFKMWHVGKQLAATCFVLHYENRTSSGGFFSDRMKWREQLTRSTSELIDGGISPGSLCIENLSYPYSWIADLIDRFGLSICIDIGHLRVNRYPYRSHIRRHLGRTEIIHLHGLKKGADHKGLSEHDARSLRFLVNELIRTSYRGSLILEVFQLDHLLESLTTFAKEWNSCTGIKSY